MPTAKIIRATPPQAVSRTRQRLGPGSGSGKAADRVTPPEALSKTRQRPGPGSGSEKAADSAGTVLVVPADRRGRASSCLRGTAATSPSSRAMQQGVATRRARTSSCTRRPSERRSRTESGTRRSNTRGPEMAAAASQRSAGLESRWAAPSHKAFTVFAPNPRKRRDIQRKAEAELAALEELRLSRAMAYVSIDPSSVGGCMSLEEVRLKQQLDMMQARRKPKAMKDQVLEGTSVLPG